MRKKFFLFGFGVQNLNNKRETIYIIKKLTGFEKISFRIIEFLHTK